ncbi:MAG TPA: tetratricopeptide repeat protein, partial [Ruminiclostridium sp.]|nr:tetratricopeptide repeat protein [Ruminiclostridium sp.]
MNKFRFIAILIFTFCLSLIAYANPQQYNKLITIADGAMRKGDYQVAVINYEKALKLYPNEPTIHNNLGVAYSQINDLKNAEMHYKKAIQLAPSNSITYP